MICTNCCKDDGINQDFTSLPGFAIVKLCSEWLCDQCMDEREQPQPSNGDREGGAS